MCVLSPPRVRQKSTCCPATSLLTHADTSPVLSPVLYLTPLPSPRPCCSVHVLCRQQFTLTPFSLSLPDRPSPPPSATPSRLVFSLPLLTSCIMLWLLVLVLGCRVKVAHAPPQRHPWSGSSRLFVGRLTFLSLAVCVLRAALRHGAFVCVIAFDVLYVQRCLLSAHLSCTRLRTVSSVYYLAAQTTSACTCARSHLSKYAQSRLCIRLEPPLMKPLLLLSVCVSCTPSSYVGPTAPPLLLLPSPLPCASPSSTPSFDLRLAPCAYLRGVFTFSFTAPCATHRIPTQ